MPAASQQRVRGFTPARIRDVVKAKDRPSRTIAAEPPSSADTVE